MNKLTRITFSAVLIFLVSLSFSSAYFQISAPNSRSSNTLNSFASTSDYYSDYTRYPVYNTNQLSNSNSYYRNLDSRSSALSYQGPIASKTTTYNEYLKVKPRKTIRTISYTTTEKYLGETLYETYNMQNNNINTKSASSTSNTDYNGGFSWRNKDAFDSNSYNANDYQTYYYQPSYNSNLGYYNWRY